MKHDLHIRPMWLGCAAAALMPLFVGNDSCSSLRGLGSDITMAADEHPHS